MYARDYGGRELTFDFIRGLIKDNLVFVDRETGSIWSQLEGQAVSGKLKGQPLRMIPSIQTTWKYWRELHPDTGVLVDPGQEGRTYFYGNFVPLLPRRGKPKAAHDTSKLGLGLAVNGQSMFFPFRELRRAKTPLEIQLGGESITVHYKKEALTAWATGAKGELLTAVLVYERGWLRFFPKSKTFRAR